MKLRSVAVLVMIFIAGVFGTGKARASFFPDSVSRATPPPASGPSNISESQFFEIVSELQKLYSPIIAQFGGKLSIQADWKKDAIVAQATQMFGTWVVQISGGLARRPELSADGLSLIICHELGHHVGGFPYKYALPTQFSIPRPSDLPGGIENIWAGAEGQADYYSTQVCAKKLWAKSPDLNATFRDKVDPFGKEKCDLAYHTDSERNICYRSVTGLQTIMATLAALMQKPMPHLDTPDTSEAKTTFTDHPGPQCRMDTVFEGSICPAAHDDTVIPGKKSSDFPDGIESERDAAKYYCTHSGPYVMGLRPACWFKARL